MKIKKNKPVKFVLILAAAAILATAIVIIAVTKYNNQPYIQAKKIIEKVCGREGIPLTSENENEVKKYLSLQDKIYSYKGLYKIQKAVFQENAGMYSIVDDNSIDEVIGNAEIEENDSSQTYELYNLINISREYMMAVKADDNEYYIGVTNKAYKPQTLSTLKSDINLENSYIEVLMYDDNQTVLYSNIDVDYVCNTFLGGDRQCLYSQGSGNDLEHSNINFIVQFYQKSINQKISLSVFSDGNISIMPGNGVFYEFEGDMEAALELLNYVTENYTGCIYVER